jgi:regulator of protease activity HflC (stomatin/prohibitin superfamily)
METISIYYVIIAVVVLLFIRSSIKIVQQSEVMLIERLGRYNRTLASGIKFVLPFIEKPRKIKWKNSWKYRIDLREAVFDFPKQNAITKDNIGMEIDAMLYFRISNPVKAMYEIEDLFNAIELLTQTTLRNMIGELNFDQVLSSRDIINNKLCAVLDDISDKWGGIKDMLSQTNNTGEKSKSNNSLNF